MKKKYHLFAILVVTLLFITSCSSSNTISPKKAQNIDYHSGTDGLVMNFVEDAPPSKVYENSGLDVMVEYANKGAYDINFGKLYLSGFDETYLTFSPSTIPNLEAEGKDIFNPDGKITQTETFTENHISMPTETDVFSQTIKVSACYEYRTFASAEVCINPHTTNTLRTDICEVHPVSLSGGQGAPIAVTSIEEEIYKNKLQFRIYFENVGGGDVLIPEAINNCHTSLVRQDANKLYVEKVSFSGKTMNCEPKNPINLDERGKGFVFCFYESAGGLGDDAYNTILNIDLRYGYRSSIQKTIDILQEP